MPQIPVYGDTRVQAQPLSAPYGTAPKQGSGLEAIAHAGAQGMRVADEYAVRQDQQKAFDVEQQITSEWITWEGENRQKFQGAKAEGYTGEAQKWWQDAEQRAGQELNGRSKQIIHRSLGQKRTAALGSAIEWSVREGERHADETAGALLESTAQFGVTTGRLDEAAQQIRDQISVIAERKGWEPAQKDKATVQALTRMHVTQIDRMVDTDAEGANAYYKAHQGEIDKDQQSKIEDVIRAEDTKQWAARFAQNGAGADYASQIAKAEALKDPDRRDAAISQIDALYSRKERVKREAEQSVADGAYRLFNNNQNIPESMLQQMDPLRSASLRSAIAARDAKAGERPKQNDPGAYATLMSMPEEKLLAIPLDQFIAEYSHSLKPETFDNLVEKIGGYQRGGVEADGILTDAGRLKNAALSAGLKTGPEMNGAQTDRLARFYDSIDREIRQEAAAKGRKLSASEKQAIIDTHAANEVFLDAWGRDPKRPIGSLTPEELASAYVTVDGQNVPLSTVPATDRAEIIRARRARGLSVTEEMIVRTYLQAEERRKQQASPGAAVPVYQP